MKWNKIKNASEYTKSTQAAVETIKGIRAVKLTNSRLPLVRKRPKKPDDDDDFKFNI